MCILLWRRLCPEESRGTAVGWRVSHRGGDYQIRGMQNHEHSAEAAAAVDLNKQFAAERSHQDRQAQVEYGKALFQILIGSNGLAATALLTLAGAFKQPDVLGVVVFPIFFFLAGVWFGTRGVTELFLSKGGYGYAWQLSFFGAQPKAEIRERTRRGCETRMQLVWLAWRTGAFAAGAVATMLAFAGWFWLRGGFSQPPLSD